MLDKFIAAFHSALRVMYEDSPLDRLWKEYSVVFRDFDDLTLGRWLAQTLGQLEGKTWRLSHPLLGAYRLAAQLGHDRQIWHKRIATSPQAYSESACCRAPTLPLLTRDVRDAGLICQHCNETLVPFEEIARAKKIPIQHEAMSSTSGTDTDAIFWTRGGIASALISLPNRYMHSPVEVVSLKDLERIPELLAGFAQSVKSGEQFKVKI